MKAAIYTEYDPPEVVQVTDVEKPVPQDDEVLIGVRAAGVNPLDSHLMKRQAVYRPLSLAVPQTKVRTTWARCSWTG